MADKYFFNNAGKLKEKEATVVSAGAGDAGEIVALNASGLLDVSVMPAGVGAEVIVRPSSENLTAGDFVNLYDNAGTVNVRKADATNNSKPAHGFVLAGVTSPANATVYLISGTNTGVTGLTLGVDYFLSTTPGGVTATAPSASGNIVQFLGRTALATSLPFMNTTYFELA